MKFRIRKHTLAPIPSVPAWASIPPWRVTLDLPDHETGDTILVARRFPTHAEALAYAIGYVLPEREEPPC